MAKDRTTEAARRGLLTPDAVLSTAVELADRDGVAALTMRKLAECLGVEAMSLYYHFPNKDAILDGMVDAVFGQIEQPPKDADWRPGMRRRAHSVREVLTRHPWAIGLMDSRVNPAPRTLRHHDAVIGCLRAGGFTVAGAAHAFSLIDSYLYGFVQQELSLPFETGGADLDELADRILTQMPADELPHLAELIREHVLQPGYAYADEFEIGLELLLDGLERHRGIWH